MYCAVKSEDIGKVTAKSVNEMMVFGIGKIFANYVNLETLEFPCHVKIT